MAGDVFEELCKRHSGGEEKGKVRQQVTGDRFGTARDQKGVK